MGTFNPTRDELADSGEAYPPQQLEIGIDDELVEKYCSQALIDAGFYKEEDGFQIADYSAMKQGVVQTMLDQHVVTGTKNMAAKGTTKFELYAEILPTAPGVTSLPDSLEGEVAKNRLATKVWNLCNAGVNGYVQANIPNSGLVVVEAKVARTKVHEETGKREPTTELARFLTSDRELIMNHLTGPAGAKFISQARKLENLLGMVTERRPELAAPVARQLGDVVKQAVSSIPHADPKRAIAITAGSTESADD
jgi:hypothetical protein